MRDSSCALCKGSWCLATAITKQAENPRLLRGLNLPVHMHRQSGKAIIEDSSERSMCWSQLLMTWIHSSLEWHRPSSWLWLWIQYMVFRRHYFNESFDPAVLLEPLWLRYLSMPLCRCGFKTKSLKFYLFWKPGNKQMNILSSSQGLISPAVGLG